MTDQGLLTLFLFLHIGAAIVAFGPTFIFPLIGAMARTEPAHTNFAVRVNEMLTSRVVIPFALTMPVSGVFLIYFAHVNLAARSGWWLSIAIVLYIILISIGIFVQRPTVQRMVELTSNPPPAPAPGSPPPSGPPPAVRETAAQIQRNGSILGVLIVVIVLLMVAKPQF
jgi:predicted integral membrane protein DUF2269